MNQPDNVVHLHALTRPTDDEIEGIRLSIFAKLSEIEPLNDLDVASQRTLVRLQMTDPLSFDILERSLKKSMAELDQHEKRSSKFNLNTFRKAAKHDQRAVDAAAATRQKLAADALRKSKNGRADTSVQALDGVSDDAIAADALSKSPVLRAKAWLEINRPGRVWWDEFYGDFYTDWDGGSGGDVIEPQRVEDAFLREAWFTLLRHGEDLDKLSKNNAEAVVWAVGQATKRNTAREWLDGLVWDQQPRLATWLSQVFGTEQDKWHADVGRCWITSMVARIVQPGCKVHTMPVLYGPQGKGKSTACEILGGKWYVSIITSASNTKDFLQTLKGKVITEIAELDALFNKRTENSHVKNLISTSEDDYRVSYGRTNTVFKRTTIFVGTTNDAHWHRDETGGRRFWSLNCVGVIDNEWLSVYRDQLFAEARHLHRLGGLWWDVDEDEVHRRVMEHYIEDPTDDLITSWLATNGHLMYSGVGCKVAAIEGDVLKLSDPNAGTSYGTLITTNGLAVAALQVMPAHINRGVGLRIAKAMRAQGWKLQAVRTQSGRVVKAWVKDTDHVAQARQKSLPLKDLDGIDA